MIFNFKRYWKKKYQCLSFLCYIQAFHVVWNGFNIRKLHLSTLYGRNGVAFACRWFILKTTSCWGDLYSFDSLQSSTSYCLYDFELLDNTSRLDFFWSRRKRHCGKLLLGQTIMIELS